MFHLTGGTKIYSLFKHCVTVQVLKRNLVPGAPTIHEDIWKCPHHVLGPSLVKRDTEQFAALTLSVFVYICPPHCERNSAHIVRTFPSSFRFVFDIVAHNVVGKSKILQYVGVRSFSQFLIIFIVHSIQFFIVSSKISKFLKLDQN